MDDWAWCWGGTDKLGERQERRNTASRCGVKGPNHDDGRERRVGFCIGRKPGIIKFTRYSSASTGLYIRRDTGQKPPNAGFCPCRQTFGMACSLPTRQYG